MFIASFEDEPAFPPERRDKHVLYEDETLTMRLVDLGEGDEIPHCQMRESVLFYVLEGIVTITVDDTDATLRKGQCLITRPATLSMRAHERTRIMGVQVPAPEDAT